MKQPGSPLLMICFGNPCRMDDGIGPAFADALGMIGVPGIKIESDYQLSVEHAEMVARHEVIVFVDAAAKGPEPFAFREAVPENKGSFSTHTLLPGQVVGLANDLFGAKPRAYLLAIRGYRFDDFGAKLSPAAHRNLTRALEFFLGWLERGRWESGDGKSVGLRDESPGDQDAERQACDPVH